jgi:hypothetical protein
VLGLDFKVPGESRMLGVDTESTPLVILVAALALGRTR